MANLGHSNKTCFTIMLYFFIFTIKQHGKNYTLSSSKIVNKKTAKIKIYLKGKKNVCDLTPFKALTFYLRPYLSLSRYQLPVIHQPGL